MNERIAVTLDFTACKYIPELYKEMRTKMEWDDDFGENLSALWDILTGMPYKGDDFTIIRPVRFENIPHGQNDIFTEYVDKLCAIFQRAQDRYGNITATIRYTDSEKNNLSNYLI
ncbi:barstar family protein [Colidextribacter sp. 210702-DFI.3.9]|uniref:Barstar family protein n=1 Tax=Flintibacter faecis TaxID=2763047 RepID=A0A8J6IZK9_9FIRM|nr:barstar family protein [Flintibacter faecis]MBC5717463.1 barstar family protein [Flintibacter faecis]MCB6499413.1 barstar family protein [Colidextribacter sp. 210702-DFI.3.9]